MKTIALLRRGKKVPKTVDDREITHDLTSATKTPKRRKAKAGIHSPELTAKLRKALEDIEHDRVHTVDPNNHRDGFKELLKKKKP